MSKTQPMSTAPSSPAPKNSAQSHKSVSPPKNSENLKQTTLVLSAAMVGDDTKVLASSKSNFQGKGRLPKKSFPAPKGKETKRPKSKAGPSSDTTIVDSVENQLEDDSSSLEEGEWEVIRRKRPHPSQDEGDEEIMAESEGPSTKRVATAEAVANA